MAKCVVGTGEYTGKTGTLVELKTNMVIRNAGDEARFEKYVVQAHVLVSM